MSLNIDRHSTVVAIVSSPMYFQLRVENVQLIFLQEAQVN